jgi:arylsulfatase A-like enzyme
VTAHYPQCKPGTVVHGLAQTINMPRTVLDFLGVRAPASMAAPSLWPVLARKEKTVADTVISSPALSYPELKKPQPTNRASITDGRWLLVYGCAGSGDPNDRTASVDSRQRVLAPLTGEKVAPELYDLQTDPGCLKNVIADHKDRTGELHARFVAFLRRSSMKREHIEYFQKI